MRFSLLGEDLRLKLGPESPNHRSRQKLMDIYDKIIYDLFHRSKSLTFLHETPM